jgi:NADP-dependent 3-hydroxy acid dehydrogenase YdfG
VGSLEGRRVLVTGASSGIGAAVARAAADAGARVALLARRQEVLAELAAELDGVALVADVTDLAAVTEAVDRAAEELGGLDAVVTAAGLVRPGGIRDADPEDWRVMLEVNVLGTLHAVRAALPHLEAADHADVVTLSSMTGRRLATAELGVYAASKAGVHALSEGLRQELRVRRRPIRGDGGRGPGLVDTPIFAGQEHPVAERLEAAPWLLDRPVAGAGDRPVERGRVARRGPPGYEHGSRGAAGVVTPGSGAERCERHTEGRGHRRGRRRRRADPGRPPRVRAAAARAAQPRDRPGRACCPTSPTCSSPTPRPRSARSTRR